LALYESVDGGAEELGRVLLESKRKLEGRYHPETDPKAFEEDAHQNALRCMSILGAVEAARARSTREPLRIVEVGLGYGYVTSALAWRFGDALELYAVDHPDAGVISHAFLDAHIAEHGLTYGACELHGRIQQQRPRRGPARNRHTRRLARDACRTRHLVSPGAKPVLLGGEGFRRGTAPRTEVCGHGRAAAV
jgi:hypothetical protein